MPPKRPRSSGTKRPGSLRGLVEARPDGRPATVRRAGRCSPPPRGPLGSSAFASACTPAAVVPRSAHSVGNIDPAISRQMAAQLACGLAGRGRWAPTSPLPCKAVALRVPADTPAARPSRKSHSQRRGEDPLRRPHSRRTSAPLVSGGMKLGLLLSAEVEHLAAARSDRPRTSSTTSTDSDTPSRPAFLVKARLRTTPAPARARRSSRASRNPAHRGARPSRCRC
jgi:hypothetical protein